ncbi:MAG: alpha/beta hydrolase [Gammaproteobacteria bacterium]|nr:alpha/beta hydrolase [Gammaproteobacteria bacterium]MBU1556621.1 alpha/beta hydrolase [Gammaproteobacteria bacterium]MBU2069776.1 alpha/beta hydrolase [Gammaproteobacteria bacterium]MBU2184641.1 alpha/beta hydrolase [Gammaproteobacteria bacterium]MBU2205693.1 alpha/beta hydrolase [Gammaproteobacteria bacterium]
MLLSLMSKLVPAVVSVACFSLSAAQLPLQKPSTAAANVQLLTPLFKIAGLNRSRQVRLYLPPDYALSNKRYPVLYMHDGQNVFDAATAFAGEWGVDESLNQLAADGWLQLIVVAVDNGAEHRMTEYSGWDHPRYGSGEGEWYIRFITDTLKPYIDQHYRTLPEPAQTGIMGSSMGGLISHYAIFNQAGVFGKAGIFSPSYWYADAVFQQTDINVLPTNSRLSMLVGEKEGRDMVSNMQKMASLLRQQGFATSSLSVKTVAGAEHNEAFWRSEFSDAILFLFNPAAFYLRQR